MIHPYGRRKWPQSTRQEEVAAVHAAHDRGQHRVDENVEGVQEAGRKARKGSKEGGVLAYSHK